MNEKDFTYELIPDGSDINENNCLKPYAYQDLFGKVVEMHLSKVNLNVDTTMKYNLVWVLISLSVEIVKPVDPHKKLLAKTWYSQRKGPLFRREFEFMNENSELLFRGSSFSILMEYDARKIYRKRELPFDLGTPREEFTIDAHPSFKTEQEYYKIDDRRVYNSFIDYIGHVNNTRYGEFAYDALDELERNNLHNIRRYDMFFDSELRINDTFSVYKAKDKKSIYVRGINNGTGEISFDIIMSV